MGNVRACRSNTDRVKQEGFVQQMKEEQVRRQAELDREGLPVTVLLASFQCATTSSIRLTTS